MGMKEGTVSVEGEQGREVTSVLFWSDGRRDSLSVSLEGVVCKGV